MTFLETLHSQKAALLTKQEKLYADLNATIGAITQTDRIIAIYLNSQEANSPKPSPEIMAIFPDGTPGNRLENVGAIERNGHAKDTML